MGDRDKVFITYYLKESIEILSHNEIHKAVVSLKNLKDEAIVKYLNDYHTGIEVVVLATKAFDDIISIFSKINYLIIYKPLKLSELKGKLHKKETTFKKQKIKTSLTALKNKNSNGSQNDPVYSVFTSQIFNQNFQKCLLPSKIGKRSNLKVIDFQHFV